VQVIVAQKKDALRIPNSAMRFRPPETFMAKRKTSASGGPGRALAQATGDVPGTPEGVILKIKELRERGEQMSDPLREVMREMLQKGQIKPEQLGMSAAASGGESGGPSRFSRSSGSSGGSRGRSGGSSGGGGARRASSGGERQVVRTVYVLADGANLDNPTPDDVKSVQIKTGISDGIYTEVVEGLKEGAVLFTGLQLSTASGGAKPTNPFASSRGGPGPPGGGPRTSGR